MFPHSILTTVQFERLSRKWNRKRINFTVNRLNYQRFFSVRTAASWSWLRERIKIQSSVQPILCGYSRSEIIIKTIPFQLTFLNDCVEKKKNATSFLLGEKSINDKAKGKGTTSNALFFFFPVIRLCFYATVCAPFLFQYSPCNFNW